jgi:hypothetical protein
MSPAQSSCVTGASFCSWTALLTTTSTSTRIAIPSMNYPSRRRHRWQRVLGCSLKTRDQRAWGKYPLTPLGSTRLNAKLWTRRFWTRFSQKLDCDGGRLAKYRDYTHDPVRGTERAARSRSYSYFPSLPERDHPEHGSQAARPRDHSKSLNQRIDFQPTARENKVWFGAVSRCVRTADARRSCPKSVFGDFSRS